MRGFTLLELVFVLVIIGVLTTLSIAHYSPIRERAIAREAVAALRLIAAAERIYRMELGGYYPPGATQSNINVINDQLRLRLRGNNWDYSITSNGDDTFIATADRVTTDCQYTIDQDNAENSNAQCP